MTDERMALAELLQKSGDGDFLRSVAEAVLQILMETEDANSSKSGIFVFSLLSEFLSTAVYERVSKAATPGRLQSAGAGTDVAGGR